MMRIAILGGGGFIGGHLAKKMKRQGHWVRVCDIKNHDYFQREEISDEFILGDLKDPVLVQKVIDQDFDEVYQLAADMGGAGYIFSGENDADVMRNSALINLNVVDCCVKNKVKKVFYSSSACIYPEYNQTDPDNPNCEESSAYPANPDSEYGWEKLFSERLFLSFFRNYNLDVRIARFHNVFGPMGTWNGGKEKSPAAICRKVGLAKEGEAIEIWGDGLQTRSYLYIDECLEAVQKFMDSDFIGPLNIGSEEMVSINQLVQIAANCCGKEITIDNIYGERFEQKYGRKCPLGVRGRRSDNKLMKRVLNWEPSQPLSEGILKTFKWISERIKIENYEASN
jgi:nucleoside-diphosphate-sugar epimerase